jgi:ribosomal-protein-alanine N-acetyltransferase
MLNAPERGINGTLLRVADRHDLPAIVEIERATFPDPWSRMSFLNALDHSRMRVIVATAAADTRIVGYTVSVYVADEGELANIAVAADNRGKGVGGALLSNAVSEGWRRGARQIFLEVRESNQVARRLYERAGFRETMRRPRYYSGPVEDAIVMVVRRSDDEADE